jgi:hypothetical protein
MEGVWIAVGSAVIVALLLLAVLVVRLRARVRRLERKAPELARTVVDIKSRSAMERAANSTARPVPATIVRKPSDEDGETTTLLDPDPPTYAPRPALSRAEEPLPYPDLLGCEDIADEAARPRLGADEKTPPRHGRARVLVPTYREPERGGAA